MKTRKQHLIAKYSSQSGFKGKVTAKCIECIFDENAQGTWRKQTQDCTATTCPLYPLRPTSEYAEDNDTEEQESLG